MYQMMQWMWGAGCSAGAMFPLFWVTTLLVWTIMVLAIVALLKWIKKK